MREVADVDRVGEVLADRFELIAHLGSGGMGSVYRAHDRQLDDEVAVKLLHRELGDSAESLAMLRSEVKLARRVTSTRVARIHELVDGGQQWFLTMEFVDGVSLADVIAGGRLPIARALDILAAVCEGLSAVHAAGVIHGDVKPANILVARDGRTMLTDFGIARFAGARENTRQVVGSPAYMAPEQVAGAPLDPRTDLYSLGVVAYELATGRLPFRGRNAIEVATARLLSDPPPLGDDCPAALAAAITAAMSRDPEGRPASASGFRDALVSAPAPRPAEIKSVDVVELYLEGRWLYRHVDRADAAVDIFAEARGRAPNSALVQAGYAMALTRKWMMVGVDSEGLAAEAARAVARAMELAPHLGEVQHARGLVALHTGDPQVAAAAMRQAISRAPGLIEAHTLVHGLLLEVDRHAEARRWVRTALRLDPMLENYLVSVGALALALNGDWTDADRLLRDEPASGSIELMMAARLAAYRNDADALERLDAIGRGGPGGSTLSAVAIFNHIAAAFAGTLDRRELYAMLPARSEGVSRRRHAVAMQLRAEVAGVFGDLEVGLEALEASDVEGRLIDTVWVERCPLLDELRGSPRFARVRDSVAARAATVIEAFGLT